MTVRGVCYKCRHTAGDVDPPDKSSETSAPSYQNGVKARITGVKVDASQIILLRKFATFGQYPVYWQLITSESDELELLLVLVKDYEDKHIVLPEVDPIDAIKLKMEERGLKAEDLEPLIGSKGHVSSILSGRRELTLKMAQKLKDYFHLPADIFMPTA
jgi:HTH-type transcriptional regulator/antitoxin HigA